MKSPLACLAPQRRGLRPGAMICAAMLLATPVARAGAQVVVPRPGERTPVQPIQPTWVTKAVRAAPMVVTGTGEIAGWQTKAVRTTPMQLNGTGEIAGWQTKAVRTTPMQLNGTGEIAGWQTKAVRAPTLQLTGTGAIAGWQTKSIRTAPMQVTGAPIPEEDD